jgi:general secretion pathway protein C
VDSLVDLYQQHQRRLATLLSVVLVVAISLAVANAVVFVVEHLDDGQNQALLMPSPSANPAPVATPSIAGLDLFGEAQQEVQALLTVEAPETRLNLELQGVFTSEVAEDSSAIVAERGKDGELFAIGDRLPGNAILEAVFDDHILLKRGGQIEKLMFSDSALRKQFSFSDNTPATGLPTPVAAASDTATRLQQVRERIAARQRTNRPAPEQPGTNLRDFVNDYRDKIATDPEGVLSELGVSAVAEGEASGYRLGNELPSQQMLQAGLQEGDLILSVNGTPVGDIRNDAALIDQTMAQAQVRVEIQRNDRRFFLSVPVPQQ